MKRIVLLFSCLVLASVPACRNKKVKKTCVEDAAVVVPEVAIDEKAPKSLFLDESLEELELLDDEVLQKSFEHDDATIRSMVAGDSLFEHADEKEALADQVWASRRIDQAKYGLQSINFDLNRYAVRPSERQKLEADAKAVKKLTDQGRTIVVEGHACRYGGSPAYNMMLSEKRAKVVADYLIKQGVMADQLRVVGRGNEMPLVLDGSKEMQAPNRRVELYPLEQV